MRGLYKLNASYLQIASAIIDGRQSQEKEGEVNTNSTKDFIYPRTPSYTRLFGMVFIFV